MNCRYDNSMALKELARDSEEKHLAWEHGLIRPFLLLVSMHPKRRAIWVSTNPCSILVSSTDSALLAARAGQDA
jgi:hypothetical protein